MKIKNGQRLENKYERLLAINQAKNGEELIVFGNFRDINAIRVFIFKKRLNIRVTSKTIDAEKDLVRIQFN